MRHKKYAFLFLLLILFVMTGCARVDDRIVLDNDGGATRVITVTVDKKANSYSEINSTMSIKKAKEVFTEKGYKIKDIEETEDVIKFEMTEEIKEIDSENLSVLFNGDTKNPKDGEILTITEDDNFFYSQINTSSDLELKDLQDKFGSTNIDYRLYIQFPEKVKGEHNAQAELDEGKTLAWKINLGELKNISFDLYTISYNHIYMVGGPVIGCLLIAFYLLMTNKEKQNTIQRRDPVRKNN